MLQDIFQAIGGNDMPGVLQLVVGMADGIFGDMNPEDVVQALFMSRQLIDELIAKYSAQLPQTAAEEQEPPALDAPPVDDEEDGEEINRMIHESRAQKHGLLWNQDKYRFETQDHQPLFFDGNGPEITADGVRYRIVTEEEWAAHEAVRNQHQAS